ncbi:Lrp/AsnC family transcriptional regulator [Romeria aff. gracilis LEGE 07310]|uniref:Lrp/AsnC family transcriptional regulator n=1 Tax=Vasconcelosia minhoensis LEGE 07310 TaxID=915328 RepID=A0A8J7AMY7_9CYAN|nr:Lrp/AsnC family transcriptional regulator [Romeria gracilis]MBE9077940.1 Lrp/AsnC family transcriptional regulator [Romeria aff. gracilis LEGE 07310]
MVLDSLDLKIIQALSQQGRATWSELAERFEVSSPAIADRVRRLEKRGILQGYTIRLDAPQLGYDLTAFISVSLEKTEHRPAFLAYVESTAEIQECHHVTGSGDYLLKVRCRNTAQLEQIISHGLKGQASVGQTHTAIVLSTAKETLNLPLTPD